MNKPRSKIWQVLVWVGNKHKEGMRDNEGRFLWELVVIYGFMLIITAWALGRFLLG